MLFGDSTSREAETTKEAEDVKGLQKHSVSKYLTCARLFFLVTSSTLDLAQRNCHAIGRGRPLNPKNLA